MIRAARILLAAFALVLLIALSSYDRSDPSYSFTGEPARSAT